MLVYNSDVKIDVDENEVEMMKYCDLNPCKGDCPYYNECDEFCVKHHTIPFHFYTEDGKPLTSL